MGFSLKRWGAHFCPPPILPAKKACFLPPFQVFGHVAHMFFRFLLHRFCVFLHDFCVFSPFFVRFSACANRILAVFGSNLLCFPWSSHANFAEFSDLYGWNYPVHPSVWLKLHNTPSCTVEIIQHALLSGWNYPVHPSVWLKLPCTPSCTVEIILYTLLYGLIYPARPEGAEALSPGQRPGYKAISNAPCKGKSFKIHLIKIENPLRYVKLLPFQGVLLWVTWSLGRAAVGFLDFWACCCELLSLRPYLKPANFKRIIQKKREKWWQSEKIVVNLQL